MRRIEVKIILSIILFTIFIVGLQRYQLSENLVKQFQKSKQDRNMLLINTITPIVSLNITLGLEESYYSYLNKIAHDNPDLEAIHLIDKNNKQLYVYLKKKTDNLSYLDFNYVKKNILDSLTAEKIATIELNFSNDDYETIIRKNTATTLNIFLISALLLALFLFLIKREFKNLQKLTQYVLAYDPKQNNFPLEKMHAKDEITLIHNAIVSMVQKINTNAKELDNINNNLERKITERTKELEIQKEKAEKLVDIKSNFFANISHEIRTPMNVILGTTHLMVQTTLTKQQKKYLKKIHTVSNSLLLIINDILDFSKLEAQKLKISTVDFNLDTLRENLLYIFEDKAQEKELNFTIEHTYTNSIVKGDSLRIEQVLINLISNAIKFTQQGEVNLKIESLDKETVRFCVSDSGIGIEKKQQKYLFEPFMQADESTTRKYGGTGLGLSISQQLLKQMSSQLHVKSTPQRGSRFFFELSLPQGTMATQDLALHKFFTDSAKSLYASSSDFTEKKQEISASQLQILFDDLLEAAKKKLPKICQPIMEELEQTHLSPQDTKLFQEIELLFEQYKFKDIILVLEQR